MTELMALLCEVFLSLLIDDINKITLNNCTAVVAFREYSFCPLTIRINTIMKSRRLVPCAIISAGNLLSVPFPLMEK